MESILWFIRRRSHLCSHGKNANFTPSANKVEKFRFPWAVSFRFPKWKFGTGTEGDKEVKTYGTYYQPRYRPSDWLTIAEISQFGLRPVDGADGRRYHDLIDIRPMKIDFPLSLDGSPEPQSSLMLDVVELNLQVFRADAGHSLA
jgi:hypothetical protein